MFKEKHEKRMRAEGDVLEWVVYDLDVYRMWELHDGLDQIWDFTCFCSELTEKSHNSKRTEPQDIIFTSPHSCMNILDCLQTLNQLFYSLKI